MQANSGGRENFSMSQGLFCFENNIYCRVIVPEYITAEIRSFAKLLKI